MNNRPDSVSIDLSATLLNVSRRTIYNWIRNGRLQTIRTLSGGSQRVLLSSLVEMGFKPQVSSIPLITKEKK